ncbi:MAG: hypothetical protein HKN80_11690 [Acidimicrobiia bacterium]|nr:hypothetical protein [Acidimicrobiia bacterium]
MAVKRSVRFAFVAALMLSACGGGEMSLTEYVDRLNVIVEQARQQYEALVTSSQGGVLIAEADQIAGFTPQDLQTALERVREIEAEVEEATAAIDPPEPVAELHNLFFDFDNEFISAQEALGVRAGMAADWTELSESPEMAAYRSALAADKQHCFDVQAEVNTIGEQGETFANTPWIPSQLMEIFEVALGCDGYPENPQDLYRPPPGTAP